MCRRFGQWRRTFWKMRDVKHPFTTAIWMVSINVLASLVPRTYEYTLSTSSYYWNKKNQPPCKKHWMFENFFLRNLAAVASLFFLSSIYCSVCIRTVLCEYSYCFKWHRLKWNPVTFVTGGGIKSLGERRKYWKQKNTRNMTKLLNNTFRIYI